MDFSLVEKIVDEIKKKKGVRTSYLHRIGEPLLHPRIFDIINLVASSGIRTSLSTNGLLLNKFKNEILSSNLSEITLCLDGITKKTYENFRIGSNFEEVLYNIFDFLSEWSLIKSKIHVQVQLIIMGQTDKELIKFRNTFSKFSSRGSFEVLVKPFSTFSGRVKDLPGNTPSRRIYCDKPFRELSIWVDGKVSYCCRDFDWFGVVGDLTKQSIQEIWHGKKMNEYRNLFREGRQSEILLCKNC